MEIREMTKEDFDSPMIESIRKLSFVSETLSSAQLKEIFFKRNENCVTVIAIEKGDIVGHLVTVIHWSFIGTRKAMLFDYSIRKDYEGTWLSLKIWQFMKTILKERHQVNYFVGPVSPDKIRFYQRIIGATIDPNLVFMTGTIIQPE